MLWKNCEIVCQNSGVREGAKLHCFLLLFLMHNFFYFTIIPSIKSDSSFILYFLKKNCIVFLVGFGTSECTFGAMTFDHRFSLSSIQFRVCIGKTLKNGHVLSVSLEEF